MEGKELSKEKEVGVKKKTKTNKPTQQTAKQT